MTKKYFILFFFLFFFRVSYGQILPYHSNEWDTVWTYTEFHDSFDSTALNIEKWNVLTDFGRGNCVFVDLPGATYLVYDGKLRLTMIEHSGYCYDINDSTICPDYISAELVSKEKFKYGIYEGRMKFAVKRGSWPAFWFFGGSGAEEPRYNEDDYASEIDIAEHNWYNRFIFNIPKTEHVLHWWWPDEVYGSEQMSIGKEGKEKVSVNRDDWHTFKLIYTPYYLEFYVDDELSWKKSRFYIIDDSGEQVEIDVERIREFTTVYEHEWFPKHEGNIRLSQQVSGNINRPVAPQTSLFDRVTFKKFFRAPKITSPSLIYSHGNCTAKLDVDSAATNISWSLSPPGLFADKLSGSGKTAEIRGSSNNGEGKITFRFEMPGGETFETEKKIWVSAPVP